MSRTSTRYSKNTQIQAHCVLCVPALAHRYTGTLCIVCPCTSTQIYRRTVYCRNIPPAQASFSSSAPFSELAHSRVSGTPPVRVRRVCCRQNPRPHRSPRLASWRHAVSVCWFDGLTAELWAASWCFSYYEVHSTMSEEHQQHNHKRHTILIAGCSRNYRKSRSL